MEQTRMDWNGLERTRMDWNRPKNLTISWNGLAEIEKPHHFLEWARTDQKPHYFVEQNGTDRKTSLFHGTDWNRLKNFTISWNVTEKPHYLLFNGTEQMVLIHV